MTDEEKKAIKLLEEVSNAKSGCDYEIALFDFGEYSKTILNLIEKQYKRINELEKALIDDDYKHRQEIEKKDKIMHSMAKHIRNPKVIFEGGRGHQHIIEYFEKKEEDRK